MFLMGHSIFKKEKRTFFFCVRDNQGFTMIELIAVLAILGFLSMIAMLRFSDLDAESHGARESVKNHIRLAQILAMKSNSICGIRFNGSQYWLFRNSSVSDKVTLANSTVPEISITGKLGTATESIYFDLWGTPFSDAGLSIPRTSGLIGSLGITITSGTGFVQ